MGLEVKHLDIRQCLTKRLKCKVALILSIYDARFGLFYVQNGTYMIPKRTQSEKRTDLATSSFIISSSFKMQK